MASRVSLVELISAGVRLRSAEAVAIVEQLCCERSRGALRGIPSPHVIRLTIDGAIAVEGPIDTDDSPVRRAAELLDTLLPGFDAPSDAHVPGALRIVIARALGTLDLPPYRSLDTFCEAIRRFGEGDPQQAIRGLYERWREAAAMTVSDVRRARRATRMPLERVAWRSGIPLVRLRELEWGYMRNWCADERSREWLARYARVVGLEEQVVMDAVWPLIATAAPVVVTTTELVPSATRALVPAEAPQPRRKHSVIDRWLAVAAAVALTIAAGSAFWPYLSRSRAQPPEAPASMAAPATVSAANVAAAAAPVLPAAADHTVAIVPAAYVPSSASIGTAAFVRENGSEAVLRITKVNDEGADDFHARPSPDGALIAFDSDRDGTRAVYVANAEGSGVRRISGDGFAAMPSWSPDGRRLAYVKAENTDPDVWNVWVADVTTGKEQRLTDYTAGVSWGASWFPDGRHLAFGREHAIMMIDVATHTRRALDVLPHGRTVRTVAVSPNGRRVVFSVKDDGAWVMDVASGSAHRVLDDPTADNFAWSPDARRVAFHSARSGGWNVCILAQ